MNLNLSNTTKHVRRAIIEAQKARHHQHFLGCILVRGGSIVSVGHNFSHIHAEAAAINHAWPNSTVGTTLLIVRVRRNGTLGISKPCEECMQLILQAGVKKVIYTDTLGQLQSFKPTKSEIDLKNPIFSYFNKMIKYQ